MSSPEFEKKVQELMDELKLNPSVSTWGRVESRIRERKNRRQTALLLSFLFMGLLSGAYLLLNNGPDNAKSANQSSQKEQQTEPADKASSSSTKQSENNSSPITTADETYSTQNDVAKVKSLSGSTSRPLTTKNEKQDPASARTNSELLQPYPSLAENKNLTSRQHQIIRVEDQISKPNTNKVTLPKKNETAFTTIPQLTANRKSNEGKWQWGISGQIGMSDINDGLLSFMESSAVADVAASNPTFAAQPNPSVYTPSSIRAGLGFSAGAFARRILSKRLSVSSGLNYHFYNTYIEVGERINSTITLTTSSGGATNVSQYYSAFNPGTYSNRYHFIELPANLHTRLTRNEKLPVYWNLGISVSQLIATNALHFEGATGVYYQDNDLFNKTQFGIGTGFSIQLLNNSKTPLWVGPHLHYNVTNLMDKDVSDGKHLVFFGLDAKFFVKSL
jgi:hypothetical protein